MAGIRAQALDSDGGLVDDFRISIRDRVVAASQRPVARGDVLARHRRTHRHNNRKWKVDSVTQPLSQGLWGVLATPFDDDLDVDLDSLRNEVASFAADGAGGLVALGVFGEAASLNPDEANGVAHTVASSTDLPFVLGLSERDPDAVVEQARRLLDAVPRPPVALMAQIGDADPAAAAASLRRLHDATGVGILIQDYPVVSGVSVTDEQVVEIVSACPFAVGVKSETPPTSVAVAHLASKLDVPVFGGLGGVGLLDELAAGSAGAMTGFSHPAALAAVLQALTATVASMPPATRGRRGFRSPTSRDSCGSACRSARNCCGDAG